MKKIILIAAINILASPMALATRDFKQATCADPHYPLTYLLDLTQGTIRVIDHHNVSIVVQLDNLTVATNETTGKVQIRNEGHHEALPELILSASPTRNGFAVAKIFSDHSGRSTTAKCIFQ